LNHQAHKLETIFGEHNVSKKSKTRFIAVTSGKGGVGKTTISANMGFLMAKRGIKTGVFDADIGLANLDVMLGLNPQKTILNLLKGDAEIADIILPIDENCFLVPGESGNEILKFSDQFMYDRFYSEIEKLDFLDYLILDTGAGIGEHITMFSNAADEVIVVTTPDPAAITDAYAMLKVLSAKKERMFLLVNQAQDDLEGERVFERVRKVAAANLPSLKLISAGSLPKDNDVTKSVRSRYLFSKEIPASKASIRLDKIIDRILNVVERQMLERREESGFNRFFKRLLNQF
jgi:flagellar biosynthesis protein FlhG